MQSQNSAGPPKVLAEDAHSGLSHTTNCKLDMSTGQMPRHPWTGRSQVTLAEPLQASAKLQMELAGRKLHLRGDNGSLCMYTELAK